MLLKRLAFTIYSSEVDQYQKYLPDIQGKTHTHTHTCLSETNFLTKLKPVSCSSERLVESLRLPQVPILHAQVFLFFRVLLLRMSPQHLTSLWPTMITELVRTSPRCSRPHTRRRTLTPSCFTGSSVSADGAGAHS